MKNLNLIFNPWIFTFILGGPLLVRAAWYTAGAVGGEIWHYFEIFDQKIIFLLTIKKGLGAIAATAPSEKFLNMGGALAIGFGLVFASFIGKFTNNLI